MNFFSFLAAFLLLRRLRKSLEALPIYTKWNKVLNYFSWFTVAIFIIVNDLLDDTPAAIFGLFYLSGIIYFFYKDPDFKTARPLLWALYPFVLVNIFSKLIKFIFPDFHKQWDDYFDMAVIGGFVWIFAIWVNYNKQQRALDYERQQRQSEEEQKKHIAIQKDELEVLVAERTVELTKQKEELQHTLSELRATQTQLIQTEKMASLGELTAGIAHEIQNPLNFVNNFSEVNAELIAEMKEEINKGNFDEVKVIAEDIKENEEKINFHGKRADGIVKGMLQHSRLGTGKKELTDINTLADEYLRLSYHGLRAKDKAFNAIMQTDFDESIGKINIIPQDIGRVLLNLYNNAFYALAQKKKASNLKGENYEPTLWVTSKRINSSSADGGEGLKIIVKDNGNGIPKEAADKIFQPFFTTKPTGEGTGLGLSISYDIITKAHEGEIKVETEEGEYTKFTIILPTNNF